MGPHPFCWLSWTGIFAGPLGGSRGSYTSTRGNFKGKTLNSFDCPLLYRFSWTLLSPMSIKGRVDRTST